MIQLLLTFVLIDLPKFVKKYNLCEIFHVNNYKFSSLKKIEQ